MVRIWGEGGIIDSGDVSHQEVDIKQSHITQWKSEIAKHLENMP